MIEARAAAPHGEPMIRILDLRRAEKPRHSSEAADALKIEASSTSSKDPAAALPQRVVGARDIHRDAAEAGSAAARAPQTPLERLREMAGSELVRASTMVLRDGGGEIRLVLKPESLGSVRIRMNLVDNAIEGRIIVDSAAVKHVFDGKRGRAAPRADRGRVPDGVPAGLRGRPEHARPTSGAGRNSSAGAVRRIAAQGFERNVPGVENVSLGDLFVNLFV